jgi:hypothetical protein
MTTTSRPAAGTPATSEQHRFERPSRQGWWGVLFALGNLVCQAAVSLPKTSHTTAFIDAYYAEHRVAITVTQLAELALTVALWLFVRALSRSQDGRDRRALLLGCAWALVGCSLLTVAPVLALAWLPGRSEQATRFLATWTDLSDVVLFVVVTGFGLVWASSGAATWVRLAGLVLAAVSLGRVVLYLAGSHALDNWAGLAFTVFLIALGVRLLRRPVPRRRS